MTLLAPNALMVGLVQTLSGLPVFLLIIPAGALADLVDRRRLLLFAQGWMFVAAALLGWLTVEGVMTPWVLLLLTFVLGIGAALNGPAWQASLPELVSRDGLTAAIALNGIQFNLARAIGSAFGGVLVAAIGAGSAFLINAASFLGVVLVLYRWRREPAKSTLPVLPLPNSLGIAPHWQPMRRRQRMPLNTTRSGVGGRPPLWFRRTDGVGSNHSRRSHYSSKISANLLSIFSIDLCGAVNGTSKP